MNQYDINCFHVLAESLNYTQAAATLFITQPALSRIIMSLEKEVGAKLFKRNSRMVMLTSAGEAFLKESGFIFAAFSNCVRQARLAESGKIGQIAIGYPMDFFNGILTDILSGFRNRHPDIDIRMRDFNASVISKAFADNLIDISPIVYSDEKPEDPQIGKIAVNSAQECIVVPKNSPLYGKSSVFLKDITDNKLIILPRFSTLLHQEFFMRSFIYDGSTPNILITAESTSIPSLLMMVACGCGETILPDFFKSVAPDYVKFVPIEDAKHSELCLIWKKDSVNPCVGVFAEYAKAVCGPRLSCS